MLLLVCPKHKNPLGYNFSAASLCCHAPSDFGLVTLSAAIQFLGFASQVVRDDDWNAPRRSGARQICKLLQAFFREAFREPFRQSMDDISSFVLMGVNSVYFEIIHRGAGSENLHQSREYPRSETLTFVGCYVLLSDGVRERSHVHV